MPHHVAAVIAPRGPHENDSRAHRQVGRRYRATVDVVCGESWQPVAHAGGLELLHALRQQFQAGIVGLFLLQRLDGLACGGIVGSGRSDKVFPQQPDGHGRIGMVVDEHLDITLNLRRRGRGNMLTERCHQLVVLRAFYLQHLQVGGVAVHLDLLARLGEHRRLREIGEDDSQRRWRGARYLIGEASTLNLYGVYAIDTLVIAVDIKLALVHLQEAPFNLEVLAVLTTRDEDEKSEKEK